MVTTQTTGTGYADPAGLGYDPSTGNTIVYPASHGRESNRLTLGDNPTAQLRRRFDSAGDLVAGFANSFVFEFTGDNADFTSSIANFAFVQPLLRGAGKHIALEQLTQAERNLLAAIRAYSQYRQGFFTRVTIGESAVTNVRRGSRELLLVPRREIRLFLASMDYSRVNSKSAIRKLTSVVSVII